MVVRQDDYVARSQGYGTQDGFFEIVKPSANSITLKMLQVLMQQKKTYKILLNI